MINFCKLLVEIWILILPTSPFSSLFTPKKEKKKDNKVCHFKILDLNTYLKLDSEKEK